MLHGLNYAFFFFFLKLSKLKLVIFSPPLSVNSVTTLSFPLIITEKHLWEYHLARVKITDQFFFFFLKKIPPKVRRPDSILRHFSFMTL